MAELREESFTIVGMNCVSCAKSAEKALCETAGVESAQVSFTSQTARVAYEAQKTDFDRLATSIRSVGYTLLRNRREAERADVERLQSIKIKMWAAIALTAPVVYISMFMKPVAYTAWLLLILTTPTLIYCGGLFFQSAFRQARVGSLTMDTLVAIGAGGAFLLSFLQTVFPHLFGLHQHLFYESAGSVIAFVLIGKYLEDSVKLKSQDTLGFLDDLAPTTVYKRIGEKFIKVPINEAKAGDEIQILTGDRIPTDAEVKSGESFVDESMISGEPIPVFKKRQDALAAGTLNLSGVLTAFVRRAAEESTLANVMRQIEIAQATTPPVQRIADAISARMVPLLLGLSVAAFVGWRFIGSAEWSVAFEYALTVIVVSCPCALGLAAPPAVKAAVSRAARQGLMVKDAAAFERAADINVIVFDKTGTLTRGAPTVVDERWFQAIDSENERLLYWAASASTHPLSKAVARYLEKSYSKENVEIPTLSPFEVAGKGFQTNINGKIVAIGGREWLRECRVPLDALPDVKAVEGSSEVWTSIDGKAQAVFFIADEIRPEAADVIKELQKEAIETVLLTGDTEDNAKRVAGTLHINEFYAKKLPHEKAEYIQKRKAEGKIVAVVGDGVNDSVAFAYADVSIATAGASPTAQATARFSLMRGDLTLILQLLTLSRKTKSIIRQNLIWAFSYNILMLPVALGLIPGLHLPPALAAAGMGLSSLIVILNSFRLMK